MTQNSKDHLTELKEMVAKRKPNQSVDEVIAIFCQRHGVSMKECRVYYRQLVKSVDIKEK